MTESRLFRKGAENYMSCEHSTEHLVGTSDGIYCKNCGRKFKDFAEIRKDRNGSIDIPKTDIPKADHEADKEIEKPKKTAVPAKTSASKTAKTTKKKAVSKSGKE